ncbi:MAG: universal stress protein [Sedimentisphaerales bacterium]|nr:universal stress protein [Sedimentisphaerales bacterium]
MEAMQHILAAVDFTPESEKALSLATRLARAHDALLHITHVVEDNEVKARTRQDQIEWEEAAGALTRETQGEIHVLFKASQRFQRLMTDGTPLPVKMLIDVAAGRRFEEIFRRMRDIPADLLILGGNEEIDLTPQRHGFVLDCLARVRAPVLLAWNTEGEPFVNVLVAVNDVAASESALRIAEQLAHFDEARLHIVHVEPSADDIHFASPTGAVAGDVEQQRQTFTAAIRKICTQLTGRDADAIEIHFTRAADPARGILEIAAEIEANLIVLARGGARTLQRIGPTTRQVIDDTECSILVVKEPGFHFDLD